MQKNVYDSSGATECPELYGLEFSPFESGSHEYTPYDPWNASVSGTTPPIRHAAPVSDEPRPPQYDDALMDDWLMARAMDGLPGSAGTLDAVLRSEECPSAQPNNAELDRLAAGMDPSAPEAFRRLCNLSLDDLDEDELYSDAALLRLFAPPGILDPGSGPML